MTSTTSDHLRTPDTSNEKGSEGFDPERRWHSWVGQHPIAGIAVTGVLATQIATVFGYFFPAINLPSLPWPLYNGVLAAPGTKFGAADSYFVGLSFHYVNGIVFAILFAIQAYNKLPFGNSTTGNFLKATTYGVVMTLISCGVLIPLVYSPHQGYGFLSFGGPDGWKLPVGVLLWHLIYTSLIASLYNPARVREPLS